MTVSPLRSALRRASLLIIEDIADQQALIARILQQTLPELNPVWAADAPSALAYLADCAEQGRPLPRLVLLDLYLPRREDGWLLLQQIKAQPALTRMPVVILSRSEDGEDIRTSYNLGVSSYIAKPGSVEGWITCFEALRHYWFDAVTFPPAST